MLMAWCLVKSESDKFKKALKDGDIDPVKLAGMSSLERRTFLGKFVGEENSKQINSLFEGKLLLKNQKAGYISWAKKVSGITPQTKRDILTRIERLDKVLDPKEEEQFLQDLASTRLRIDITQEEAKTVSELSNKINTLKEKANEEGIFPTENDRLKYGASKVGMEKYINDLKLKSRGVSIKEQPLQAIKKVIGEIPGTMKSFMSSLDNSFWGRQGIKALLDTRTANLWVKNFAKSFGDIGRELKGVDAMDLIRADIYSRPNALNGKYDAGNYGLGVLNEEAFPTSIPERIPVFGRLFKASESAYGGGALRLRADLADRFISLAEKNGVNTLSKSEAKEIGHLVGSLTGRGSIGRLEPISKEINVLLYSIKFLKSNIDTVIAPAKFAGQKTGLLSKPATKGEEFASKEAAKATMSMVGTLSVVLSIAKLLDPDSVDEDPRSTNFGKIKMFGKWVDITGGMSSLVRLASRLVPTKHNGEWGVWSKSSTGNWTNLVAGSYGQKSAWDMIIDSLFSNKLSPVAGIARDAWRGEMFGGEPFNITKSITNSVTPLSIQTFDDIKDEKASDILGLMLLEQAGFSIGTYKYKASWENSTSKEMEQFKEKVGEDKFGKANNDYNRAYNIWYEEVTKTSEYKKLSDDGKSSLITKAKSAIKDKIFKEYGFKYKTEKKTTEQKKEDDRVKNLLP